MPTGPELPPLPDHLKAMVRKSEPREFEGFPPETTTPPADRDDLAAILAKHEWCKYGVPSQPPRWWPMCSCGESFRNLRYDQSFDAHRAHVAQMVLEAGYHR